MRATGIIFGHNYINMTATSKQPILFPLLADLYPQYIIHTYSTLMLLLLTKTVKIISTISNKAEIK